MKYFLNHPHNGAKPIAILSVVSPVILQSHKLQHRTKGRILSIALPKEYFNGLWAIQLSGSHFIFHHGNHKITIRLKLSGALV